MTSIGITEFTELREKLGLPTVHVQSETEISSRHVTTYHTPYEWPEHTRATHQFMILSLEVKQRVLSMMRFATAIPMLNRVTYRD